MGSRSTERPSVYHDQSETGNRLPSVMDIELRPRLVTCNCQWPLTRGLVSWNDQNESGLELSPLTPPNP